jgi:hypothetical protein
LAPWAQPEQSIIEFSEVNGGIVITDCGDFEELGNGSKKLSGCKPQPVSKKLESNARLSNLLDT